MLCGPRRGRVRPPSIVDDAIGPQSDPAGGSDDAAAPIAEDIAVRGDRYRRAGHQVIGHHDVGRPGEMGSEDHDHRRRLWKVVDQFVTDTNLHPTFPGFSGSSIDGAIGESADHRRANRGKTFWFRTVHVCSQRAAASQYHPRACACRAVGPFRIGGSDLDLDGHLQIVRGKTSPSPMKWYRLARNAHRRDTYEVAVADNPACRIEIEPARAGQIDLDPGMHVAAAGIADIVVVGEIQISGDKTCGHPKRAHRLDHEHSQVTTTPASDFKSEEGVLNPFLMPGNVD